MRPSKPVQNLHWFAVAAGFGLFFPLRCVSAEAPVTFESVVKGFYHRWTEDDNHVLTPRRVNELIQKSDIRGPQAAALAAIHAYQNRTKNAQALTLKEILGKKSDNPKLRRDHAASGANIGRNFDSFAKHLRTAPRHAFMVDRPTLDTMTQGNLGDCFFVASVGGVVHNNPEQILKMFKLKSPLKHQILFPNGRHVSVPALTDAQLALSSNAGQQGVWLNILEIAAGMVRRGENVKELPLDNIGTGGDSAFSIHLLTGHHATRNLIRENLEKEAAPPDEKDLEKMANRFRKLLREALDRRAVICCSSGLWHMPPGMIQLHEYAVLGLQFDRVDVWNPWGYTYNFEPKGKAGYEHGYHIEGGRCSIPMKDFLKIFGRVTVENVPVSDKQHPAQSHVQRIQPLANAR